MNKEEPYLGSTLGLPLPPLEDPIVWTSSDNLFCRLPNVIYLRANSAATALIDSLDPPPGSLDLQYIATAASISSAVKSPIF